VTLLREQGFDRAVNVAGGILAWVDRIEPHKSKY
jgi:rhodanese-related sulfurtransferase